MKKWLALCVGVLVLSFQAVADDYQATIQQFKKSDRTTPFFNNAYGYAVFPTIGKGGIGIGGAYGEGKVYRGGATTGSVNMGQVTLGFQLGGQAFSQIIFLQDKRAYDEFTGGSFEFGAQASAVALTVGASAQAGTSGAGAAAGETQSKAHYVSGYAVFTLAKGGLMYEASIGGQKFNFTAE
ncbi:YSC84-related protein [Agarivorans aestuarii]|uniref:YSC84-related protein n=1 Tax=Agarivorans aestuarii TaxID=1563703 RepID=UPI001C802919|nr:YSC84-related protein [Agarivorans aestuarii]